MASVGEDPKAAADAVEAIFKALPKTKQAEHLGDLNEVLLYIQGHPPKTKR